MGAGGGVGDGRQSPSPSTGCLPAGTIRGSWVRREGLPFRPPRILPPPSVEGAPTVPSGTVCGATGGGRRVRAWASPHSFHGKLEAGFLGEGWRSWGGGEPGRSGGWPGLARAGRLATAGAEVGSSCRAGLGARSLLSGPSEPWPRCGGSQILLLLLLLLLGLSLTQWMLTVPVAAEATTGTAPLRSPCSPVPGPVGSGSPWSPCPRCSALWRICSQTLFLLQNR